MDRDAYDTTKYSTAREPQDHDKLNRLAEKQRLKGTLFWDSQKLGTYKKLPSERNIRPGAKRRGSYK